MKETERRDLLVVKNLKKYFDTPAGKLHAVDNVSFVLKEGMTLGVVGESGCGKSTMGRTILRLHEPTDGQVLFDGTDVSKLNRSEMKKMRTQMQIIFQDPYASLNARMTVKEAIAEPLLIHKVFSPKSQELTGRVKELMNLVGLAPRLINSYPHELDGGRRQRIGIARALALNPKFVVCDEPVSALDVSIQAQVINLMQDLQKQLGITYMFITHDMSVVKHLSDDIIVMYLGEIVEKCSSDRLFKNPVHPYTKSLLSAIPVADPEYKVERVVLNGELSSPINPPVGCRFAKRCKYATDECRSMPYKLIEIEPEHYVSCARITELDGIPE